MDAAAGAAAAAPLDAEEIIFGTGFAADDIRWSALRYFSACSWHHHKTGKRVQETEGNLKLNTIVPAAGQLCKRARFFDLFDEKTYTPASKVKRSQPR